MDLHEILKKAKDEVEEADLPEEYKLKAFEKAIELLSGSSGVSNKPKSVIEEPTEADSSRNTSVLQKIASQLGVEPQALEEVYYMDDELKIIIGTSRLDSSVAGATKEIALLTAGGRQLGALEEWTDSNSIRENCEYMGKYDSSNFAKTIRKMDDVFSFMGSGQDREVKIIRPGIERLKELILSITERNG